MTTNAASRQRAKFAKTKGRSVGTGLIASRAVIVGEVGKETTGSVGVGASVREEFVSGAFGGTELVVANITKTLPQTAVRTGFLIEALGSGAEVARLLGVNRSQPSQWRSGKESPSPKTARQLLDLDYVVAKALQIWPAETALEWFHGSNDYLEGARPIDVLKRRGTTEIIKALDVEMA